MSITIYHNPKCSKSRQTLSLLQEHGFQPNIIEYLKQPPSPNELKQIIAFLGYTSARDLLRTKEPEYKTLNLADKSSTEKDILCAMHNNPKLIERPIVVKNNQAVVGRPPENVLALIMDN
tara:strand:+ start:77870 stop:78229 length:360 start_codon:yes stop_codon:yes gene_type:complete